MTTYKDRVRRGEIKEVKGFEGYYSVSNLGEIFSTRYGKIKERIAEIKNGGYMAVTFQLNHEKTLNMVHILVAEHFVPNPFNYPCVLFFDGDRKNCKAENLFWAESTDHSIKVLIEAAEKRGYDKGVADTLKLS